MPLCFRTRSSKKGFCREWHTQGNSIAVRAESTSRDFGSIIFLVFGKLVKKKKKKIEEDF